MKSIQSLMASVAMMTAFGCSGERAGFAPLFNGKDMTGWVEIGSRDAWSVEDGVLKCTGRHDGYAWLCTERKYGDFVLTLDWRVPPGANTGIFCRVPAREGRASMTGFEVQAADDATARGPGEITGSIFNRAPARVKVARPPGQWNHYEITVKGRSVRVVLNGVLVNEVDMNTIESMRDVPPAGYIGLQNHGSPAEFRDVRIRECAPEGRDSACPVGP